MALKLNLGKTLAKALEAGATAAAATAALNLKTTGDANPAMSGIVGAIVGLVRAIINVVKVVKKIRAHERVG